jgi:LL-diaminopimelate aminotransferase
MKNAKLIANTMRENDISFTGGDNSPYVWLKCGMNSWDYFDMLLEKIGVVGTPGAGFGINGEGYFRLTAFGEHESTKKAMKLMGSLSLL